MRQIQRFYRVLNKEMDSIGSKCKKKRITHQGSLCIVNSKAIHKNHTLYLSCLYSCKFGSY